jgi:uncharacterized protein YprB with RNaseH-like and TPR domain
LGKWTPEELSALAQTAHLPGKTGYAIFGDLTNFSRDINAWEVKKRRYNLSDAVGKPVLAPVASPESPYYGFRMGFFDIETTFSMEPIILYAAIMDQFGNVEQFRHGGNIIDDKPLVDRLSRALEGYDIILTWNGKLFDVPVLNARLRSHGFPPVRPGKHIDLMYYASGSSMRLGRRSLQHVSEYFDSPNRKTPLSVTTWNKALAGDEAAYEDIVEHCDSDVRVTGDVFLYLSPLIANIHR